MLKKLKKMFKKNDKGQGIVEFGLILALVSVVAIGSLSDLGDQVTNKFDAVVGAMGGGNIISEKSIYSYEEIDTMINQESYIPITTAEELAQLGNSANQTFGQGTKWEKDYTSGLDKKYVQVTDIDLSGIENWEPIGVFTGIYDGGEFEIANLNVNTSGNYSGLFSANGPDSIIKNVGLTNVSVKGVNNSGGLIGFHRGKIINCFSDGSIEGSIGAGGLIGHSSNGHISNSYSNSNVKGVAHGGGLVGSISGRDSTINNSYATGNVQTTGQKPGYGYAGGLVSSSYATITNSYATGDIIGSGEQGSTGGLVGINYATITNSYASGDVRGGAYKGGLVGRIVNGEVNFSYSSGNASGGSNVGGLVGEMFNSFGEYTRVNNSHTLDKSGLRLIGSSNYYKGNNGSLSRNIIKQSTSLSGDEVNDKLSYSSWDFDTVWEIEEGKYPTLQWQHE